MAKGSTPTVGQIVYYRLGDGDSAGVQRPAIVTAVYADGSGDVNLVIFGAAYHSIEDAHEVHPGDANRQWSATSDAPQKEATRGESG